MQRYQPFPPTPPSNSTSGTGEMVQMRNYLFNSHFFHTKEMAGLQRAFHREAQSNLEEIEGIKSTVQRDLQTLQGEIKSLKTQVTSTQQGNVVPPRSQVHHGRLSPEHLDKDFSQTGLAEIYLEEAETMEAAAAKLRKQAAELSGGGTSGRLGTMRLLEGARDMVEKSKLKADFACCSKKYDSVDTLLEHVGAAHRSEQIKPAERVADPHVEATPTHAPPRRMKPMNATEIQASETSETEKLRAELAKVRAELARKQEESSASKKTDLPTVNAQVASALSSSDEESWTPLAVRQMPTPTPLNIENNTETFTWEFINNSFRGEQWSPGFYFIKGKDSALRSKSYWVLEADYEPFLPKTPGQHGAKITAFFNNLDSEPGEAPDEENFLEVPVFIRPSGKEVYMYYGNFSQTRFSDKIGYDVLMGNVTDKVREYWATQLADSNRPDWVTKELMDHFWPKPTYCGPIPTDSKLATPATEATVDTISSMCMEKHVAQALQQYAMELKEWKQEYEMKAKHLTAENLLKAFKDADADADPGLRLWWEYFEFVKYDQKFYDRLVKMKYMEKAPTRAQTAPKATPSAKSTTLVNTSSDAETIVPLSPTKLQRSKNASAAPTWKASAKDHTNSVKPWEQTSQPTKTESTKPKGDIAAVRAFQAGTQKNYAAGTGRAQDGKKPPHLRQGR